MGAMPQWCFMPSNAPAILRCEEARVTLHSTNKQSNTGNNIVLLVNFNQMLDLSSGQQT